MRKNCVGLEFSVNTFLNPTRRPLASLRIVCFGEAALGVVPGSTNFSLPTTMILLNFASNQVVSGS